MSTTAPTPATPPSDVAPGEPSGGTSARSTARALGVLAAALLVTGALFTGLLTATGRYTVGADSDHTATVMPAMIAPDGVLDLTSVAPAVAAEYQHAADHAEHFRQLRCWCGCETAFDHPSLLECFVRPDGDWEAHGAGCGVCMAEAITARQRLAEGIPIADIATEIDATYGPADRPTTEQDPTT